MNVSQSISDPGITQSSLLIPKIHIGYFLNRCLQSGSRAEYLHHLVHFTIKSLPAFIGRLQARRDPKWKTHYQQAGQDLLKRNLQPDSVDWEILRHAACANGVSMCFLFVFLMEMEQEIATGRTPKKSRKNSGAGNSTPRGSQKMGRANIFVRKLIPCVRKLIRTQRIE